MMMSPCFKVPFCTRSVATGPRPLSSRASMTVPCPAVTSCAVPRGYGTICMNGTNFRTGPGTNYGVRSTVKNGASLLSIMASDMLAVEIA